MTEKMDTDESDEQIAMASLFDEDTCFELTPTMKSVEIAEMASALVDDIENEQKRRKIDADKYQELAAAVFEDDNDSEPSLEHLKCLISRFKHDKFRKNQWDIIRAVMIEKRDAFAVLSTGYGKSLCFQVSFFVSQSYFLWYEKFQFYSMD